MESQCNYLLVSTKDTAMCASLSERQLANIHTRRLNRPKIYTGLRLVLVPRPVIVKGTYWVFYENCFWCCCLYFGAVLDCYSRNGTGCGRDCYATLARDACCREHVFSFVIVNQPWEKFYDFHLKILRLCPQGG
jgi:hypothetical protein